MKFLKFSKNIKVFQICKIKTMSNSPDPGLREPCVGHGPGPVKCLQGHISIISFNLNSDCCSLSYPNGGEGEGSPLLLPKT